MNLKRLWVATGIIAVVILIGFVLSVPHTRDVADNLPVDTTIVNVPTVVLRDVFRKGTHTITGSIEAPTPCSAISADATLGGGTEETDSDRILLEISLPKDEGVCLQRNTMMKFSTTVIAPGGLPISVKVNGTIATTTNL
ncbi:MAG: hypothetical protein AAB709_01915 [Patescibacteria group bacterium]